MSDMNT